MATLDNVYGKYVRNREEILNQLETLYNQESIHYVITKVGGIGDTLAALPVVQTLEEEWPQSQGWMIVKDSMGMDELLADQPVSTIEISKGEGVNGFRKNWKSISDTLNHSVDLYIDLTQSFRSLYFSQFVDANLSLGFKWHGVHRWFLDLAVDRSYTKFEGDTFLDVPRMIGLDRDVSIPSFQPPRSSRKSYEDWLRTQGLTETGEFLVLNPGAKTVNKRWDLEKWPSLIRGLDKEFPGEIVIVEGPAEEGITEEIKGMVPEESVRNSLITHRNRPLGEVAHLASQARGVITNDTYLLHLGITLGTPTFCIFNGKDPFRYRFDREPHDYICDLRTARPEPGPVIESVRDWIRDTESGGSNRL